MAQKLSMSDCLEPWFWCFPCPEFYLGNVAANISTVKSGFVPGEEIEFEAQVENQSRIAMRWAYVQLIQTFTFKAQGNIQTKEKVISYTRKKGT